jgi:hypothetical protein
MGGVVPLYPADRAPDPLQRTGAYLPVRLMPPLLQPHLTFVRMLLLAPTPLL